MSHPDLAAPPDTRPIEPGDVWSNPVTSERAVVVELPWSNDEGRAVADLTALPGARVAGEHLHPALHESFSVQEGELTVLRDGRKSVLRAGDRAEIEPGVWHDWWFATEFSDVIVFRKPPAAVQRLLFGALAPIARRHGYRATYPTLSRTTLAPRP